MTSDWACMGTNNVIKSYIYQLKMEDDLNAKLTTLSKQVEALAIAKATTSLPKKTLTMCALCDTMDYYTDVCPIVAG